VLSGAPVAGESITNNGRGVFVGGTAGVAAVMDPPAVARFPRRPTCVVVGRDLDTGVRWVVCCLAGLSSGAGFQMVAGHLKDWVAPQ